MAKQGHIPFSKIKIFGIFSGDLETPSFSKIKFLGIFCIYLEILHYEQIS